MNDEKLAEGIEKVEVDVEKVEVDVEKAEGASQETEGEEQLLEAALAKEPAPEEPAAEEPASEEPVSEEPAPEESTAESKIPASEKRILLTLFTSTFKLSAFTFGGGYVIVPLMRKRFVEELEWIDEDEMLDLIAVSQTSPGPIAINASIIIGYRMDGVKGALVSVFGAVLPPFLVITVISYFYQLFRDNPYVNAAMEGMQAGVAAVIASAVLDMGAMVLKNGKLFAAIVMVAVFVAVYFFKVNVGLVMLVSAVVGLVAGIIYRKRGGASFEGGEGS